MFTARLSHFLSSTSASLSALTHVFCFLIFFNLINVPTRSNLLHESYNMSHVNFRPIQKNYNTSKYKLSLLMPMSYVNQSKTNTLLIFYLFGGFNVLKNTTHPYHNYNMSI